MIELLKDNLNSEQGQDKFPAINSLFAIAVFFFISLIITFPLILYFKNYAIGNYPTDLWPGLWGFSWAKKCVLEGKNIFYTSYMCYPPGGKIYIVNLFNAIISVPLQLIFNVTVTYNIVVLVLLNLGAYSAYCLGKYLTRSSIAGFVCGIIYGFSPCRISFLFNGTDHLLNSAWIPFVLLFLFKTVEEKGYTKNFSLAIFFYFLTAVSSWYMGLFASMFIGITFFYYIIFKRKTKEYQQNEIFKKFILIFLFFAILISPFVYSVVNSFKGDNNLVAKRHSEATLKLIESIEYSSLIEYFRPTPFNVRPKLQVDPEFSKLNFPQHRLIYAYGVYLGYIVLILTFIGLVFTKKKSKVRLWIYFAIFFFILSLGPYLHFSGKTPVLIFGHTIPLPYLLFFKLIPIFGIINCPTRFINMTFLCLSVLAGFGVVSILKRNKRINSYGLGFIITVLILLEYNLFSLVPYPLPLTNTNVPEFYYELAKEKDDFAIIELPMKNWNFYKGKYGFGQSIHWKKSVFSISVPSQFDMYPYIAKKNIFVNYLAYLERTLATPISFLEVDQRSALNELKTYDFRYIVVHNDLLEEDVRYSLHKYLRKLIGEPEEHDGSIMTYRIK
ncbi:MAG: hypothetical protein KAS51_03440 [Candidatus Omnitrophica bacterium]|nr:hypothetical protein [Candidatus Omnitrophota bacterium]